MHSFFFAVAILAMSHPTKTETPGLSGEQVRVMPVSRTPESNTVSLSISIPREEQLFARSPVWVQFRMDGYALGAGSQFDRSQEIANSKMGQTVHVVIDDYPYFPVDEPAINPFSDSTYFYDTSYKFEIPFKLKEGAHTIRMFPARSYGESLKGDRTFFATYFYLGEKEGNPERILSQPYLTYNEPSERMKLVENQPVLLDFYISNCELTPDGYKVQLTVDGETKRTLASWQPYYIYGLKRGKHTIRLQLLDGRGKQVSGPFGDAQRTIHIH